LTTKEMEWAADSTVPSGRCTRSPVPSADNQPRFPSSLMELALCTAGIVTRHAEQTVATAVDSTVAKEKCTKSPAQSAVSQPRFLSNPMASDLSTVGIATRRDAHRASEILEPLWLPNMGGSLSTHLFCFSSFFILSLFLISVLALDMSSSNLIKELGGLGG
jgi:hypothetical protein